MANFGTNKNSFTNYRYCLHINTLSNWHLFYFLLFKIRFGMILQSSTLSIVNQEHFCYVLLCLSDHLELSQFYNHRLLWIKTSSLLERSKGCVSVKISLLNEFNFVNYFSLMSPQYSRARKHEELLSNSGPDHLQVNSRCLPGPLQLNLYLRFRRSGPE